MYDTSLPVEEPELEDMGNHGESQDHVDGNHSRSGETLGDANDGECCRYLKHINYVLISSRVQTVCRKIQSDQSTSFLPTGLTDPVCYSMNNQEDAWGKDDDADACDVNMSG